MPVVEKEVVAPVMESIVDPDNLPPEDPEPIEDPRPDTPSFPLFGG